MTFQLLKQKNLSLLMTAKLISLIGTELQEFALSLYVLKITGSAKLFATVLAVALIPQLVLGPIGGVFADWLDRKKIIIFLDFLNAIVVGIFAVFCFAFGGISLLGIYILVIMQALISVLYQPAIGVIIPIIVKKDDLIEANGINSLFTNLGMLISPMLAGIIFGFYGLFVILVINSISFSIAAIEELFINIPKNNNIPAKVDMKAFNKDFTEGLGFIKKEKLIMVIILLATALNFAFSPFSSLGVTYISKQILKITDFQYGILEFVLVSSMMVAPFISSSSFLKKIRMGKLLFNVIFISSVLVGILAIVPTRFYMNLFKSNIVPLITLAVICFLISLFITIGNITLNTLFQQIVPISMMGRVGTVMTTGCLAFAPLGQIVFGFLYDTFSAWICVVVTSLILIVSILFFRKPLCIYGTEDAHVENANINIEKLQTVPDSAKL